MWSKQDFFRYCTLSILTHCKYTLSIQIRIHAHTLAQYTWCQQWGNITMPHLHKCMDPGVCVRAQHIPVCGCLWWPCCTGRIAASCYHSWGGVGLVGRTEHWNINKSRLGVIVYIQICTYVYTIQHSRGAKGVREVTTPSAIQHFCLKFQCSTSLPCTCVHMQDTPCYVKVIENVVFNCQFEIRKVMAYPSGGNSRNTHTGTASCTRTHTLLHLYAFSLTLETHGYII